MKPTIPLALLIAAIITNPVAGQDIAPAGRETALGATVSKEGYWLDEAPLNDVFQYLAREARLQYFFNNTLNAPEYVLTGHLRTGDPLVQMEDIAVAFGLSIYQQGATVYSMNEQQLSKLPVEVMVYRLKYLRSSRPTRHSDRAGGPGSGRGEFDKLKTIISPMLTKGAGAIAFEEKTNTLLVTDNSVKLKRIKKLLEKIDQPKPQIAVSVRVLRVSNTHGKRLGVDWESSLGDGISISSTQSLNALFNLPDFDTKTKTSTRGVDELRNDSGMFSSGSIGGESFNDRTRESNFSNDSFKSNSTTERSLHQDGAGLIFDALEVDAIVHALEKEGIVTQEAAPTIITEDNEQGLISIVDRFPIITSTVTETNAGQNVSQEVRYQIDELDPDPMEDPEKSREIGVTLSVTPTLLPDGTVRMKLRPRVAKIVDFIPGANGNLYPRVSESTAESISRVPSGKSLILGGFYDYQGGNTGSKVPVLGYIPLLGRLFRYDEDTVEKVSLVFIITPSVYDASSYKELDATNEETRVLAGLELKELYELSSRFEERARENAQSASGGKTPPGEETEAVEPSKSKSPRRPVRRFFSRIFRK